jgi:hypothetical protein
VRLSVLLAEQWLLAPLLVLASQILEWPEYLQNPSARSNRDIAVTTPYKVPTQSFDLYHSAQGHTKLKQKKPFQLYVTLLLFLSLPVIFYYTYQSVFADRSTKQVEDEKILSDVCYRLSAERLVVPSSSCKLAVRHGWPSESKRQNLSL